MEKKDQISAMILKLENLAKTDFEGFQSWWNMLPWPVGESRNLNGIISTKIEHTEKYMLFDAVLPPGHVCLPHWHNCYEDIIVVSGVMEDFENETIQVKPGEKITFLPWESHCPCNPDNNKLHIQLKFYNPTKKRIDG